MVGLCGYYCFGYFSKPLWRALTYSFLWGVAIFLLLGTLGGEPPFGFDVLLLCDAMRQIVANFFTVSDPTSDVFDTLAVCFALHQFVAIIIPVAIYVWRAIEGHDARV